MRSDSWHFILIIGGAAVVSVWQACSQAGQSRQSSVGGTAPAPVGATGGTTTTVPQTGTTTGTGGNATGITGATLTVASPALILPTTVPKTGGLALADCQTRQQAWIPVVNSGAAPATCGLPLVSWCCTRTEVESRFPALASQIDSSFQQFLDNSGEVLFACASDGSSSTTMSMAKIVGGTTTYNTITIGGMFPTTPLHDPTPPPCPTVHLSDLMKSALLLDDAAQPYSDGDPASAPSEDLAPDAVTPSAVPN